MLPETFYYKKDRLNQIRGFCTTVKFGSVNKAAKHLLLEPATVSKQIITLERDVKTKLFDRTNKRKLTLNKYGEEFYKQSIGILQSIDSLFSNFYNNIVENEEKEIKIASTHTAICHLLPRYIKEFQTIDNSINFKIFNIPLNDSLEKLSNEDVDLVIWTTSDISSEFTAKTICEFKPNIIMHKDNLLSKKEDSKITYQDLQDQNILMMDKYNNDDLFLQIIKNYNLGGNIKFINGDWESIKCFVKMNLGIHFYSEIYKEFNEFVDDDIVCKNIEHLFPNVEYKLITKNGKKFNKNIKEFLKIIESNTHL